MERIIYKDGTADVAISVGQKLAVATYGNDYATLSFKRGNLAYSPQHKDSPLRRVKLK